MINILIADDHELMREGLKKILKRESDMEVVGEARDAQEAFDRIKNQKPSIVLLDISMPGTSGLDVLGVLRKQNPEIPVLILSMHPEDRYAARALKAGAAGYITKDSAVAELVKAIRKAVSGGKYVSAHFAEQLADDLGTDSAKPPHESLSDREYQVMRLIAAGKRISEIAAELSLSTSAVNTYRTRILEKMKMERNAELTRYAIENHLID
jgi:two-component system, NarL family, invasion response regulator UvrY